MSEKKSWQVAAAAAIVYGGRVLMVRQAYGDGLGRWTLPGGMARHDERLDETAIREVCEETGIVAQVTDLIALRTRYTSRGSAVHAVFRMQLVSGQPVPDGTEVDRAGFFTAQEVSDMGDDQIVDVARNVAMAALLTPPGLMEDMGFPRRGDDDKGYLAREQEAN